MLRKVDKYILLTFAALSGFLGGLSFFCPQFSFLIWFSFVFFFFVIEKVEKRTLFLYSLLAGFSYFTTVLFWVGYVTKIGFFFLTLYLSLYWIIFAYLGKFFLKTPFSWITLPSLWIILEFFRENIWVGFGWAILGYSQYTNSFLIQSADILGVKFISWIILLFNVVLYDLIKKKKGVLKEVIFLSILILADLGYSLYRIRSLDTYSKKVSLALLQTNVPQDLKWKSFYAKQILKRLENLAKRTPPASLVIYPEASYPFVVKKSNFGEFRDFFAKFERGILVGAVEKKKDKFYNSAFLINTKGELVGKYRKLKLVPFGEYIPLRRFLEFIDVISAMGDISPGRKFKIFNYQGERFGVLICFEDTFPFVVARFARNSDFLVNITNDAWFRGNPEAQQHLGILVFRAIENRISAVRVANTGITGYISFKGEVEKFKKDGEELFTQGVFNVKLPINRERSFYCRYPELFLLIAGILLFISKIRV
ncbi:MAG: apolipoprotein N-acyltransferase [Candidatus Omnitrophota bacterium]|nr:MAG: apolipoprotein N-acyltransferase [Candidatus Omnitrophota bacterium]RKY45872.1 MAG: apolipoprotein N-acyltransferase [Candidatus Omnitrophota bacterium]HDN86362.1 apolipoprotein N-acyltransferase [Candidatus Omnitrophota bacterium]